MKKLLLLSALLIFACSSDDSSNSDVIFLRIIENLGNSFIFEGDGLQTIITANDGGNSISISNGGTAYRTNSENPCE